MKKTLILLVFVSLSSFVTHKFYVSIYQIDFNPKKKMLEITARIFIDDMNDALKLKYNQKTHLTEKEETKEDVNLMQKYLLDNFSVKINGQPKTINYINKETESNVIICYFSIKEVTKIKSIEVKNTALIELNNDQQNIIQTTIFGEKSNLLLTADVVSGILNK